MATNSKPQLGFKNIGNFLKMPLENTGDPDVFFQLLLIFSLLGETADFAGPTMDHFFLFLDFFFFTSTSLLREQQTRKSMAQHVWALRVLDTF